MVFNGPVKDICKLQSSLQRPTKLQEITDNTIRTGNEEDKTKVVYRKAVVVQDRACIAQTSSTVSTAHPTIKTDDTDLSNGEDEEKEDNPRKNDGEGFLDVLEGKWLQIEKCILTPPDRSLLVEGKRLNDHHINFAQCLLRRQFESLLGLLLTLLQVKKQKAKIIGGIQIIYLSYRLYWCVASNISCAKNEVKIYDSVFSSPDLETQSICLNLFDIANKSKLTYEPVQKQESGDDCGVFSIAFATALAHGLNPVGVHFVLSHMRQHLLECYEQKSLTPFTII